MGFAVLPHIWLLWLDAAVLWLSGRIVGAVVAESKFPVGYGIVHRRCNSVHAGGLADLLRPVHQPGDGDGAGKDVFTECFVHVVVIAVDVWICVVVGTLFATQKECVTERERMNERW